LNMEVQRWCPGLCGLLMASFSYRSRGSHRDVDVSAAEEFSEEPRRLLEQLLEQPSAFFHPQRLAIMAEMYYSSAAEFTQLRRDLGLTDGALATHLKALASQGLIEPKREQIGSRTRTAFVITKEGIAATEKLFQNFRAIGETFKR
jgi:DNA-binding MarR family transcriptional regulator